MVVVMMAMVYGIVFRGDSNGGGRDSSSAPHVY